MNRKISWGVTGFIILTCFVFIVSYILLTVFPRMCSDEAENWRIVFMVPLLPVFSFWIFLLLDFLKIKFCISKFKNKSTNIFVNLITIILAVHGSWKFLIYSLASCV